MKDLDQDEHIKKHLRTFANDPRGFIILSGKNGTGKSYAAMAVYEAVTPYKLPAYDSDIAIFITQAVMNQRWLDDINKCYAISRIYHNTKLLILDDLGTRIPTPAFMDYLYSIVDERYTKNAGTIITTNLNSRDLREHFGDAFMSRASSGLCFRFEGEDRRLKKF